MGEFIKRLGRKVQTLLNRIIGKKEQSNSSSIEIKEGETDQVLHTELDKEIKALQEKIDNGFELVFDVSTGKNELEKYANILYPFLPKHYWCKTLIVSIAANQPYEYQAMDISQLEEKGIAHFIIGRIIGFQEIEEEYKREKARLQEEENDDGVGWLREGAETGLCSMVYGEADLYHYEELGYWDFE